MRITLRAVTAFFAIALACGCSGGGGGGEASLSGDALNVAERVSVVDADAGDLQNLSPTPMIAGFKTALKAVSDLPADSAYNTDEQNVFVEERSAESFDRINEILCMMGQTAYDQMLNEGAYIAQINATRCGSSNDSAETAGESSQNQSSSSSQTSWEYWTVNSYRYEGQPHIVEAWIHQEASEFEPAMTIITKTEITESRSDSNPLGIFQVNFEGAPVDENGLAIGGKAMSGFLKAERDSDGNVILSFYSGGGFEDFGMSFSEQVALYKNPDGVSGAGTVAITDSMMGGGGQEETRSKNFNIAYNGSHFYRAKTDGSNEVCLDRADTATSAWRYGLYNDENSATPGSRISVESGFPVRYTSGGKNYQGWADYYGVWFPRDLVISSGDTVYRQTFGPGSENDQGTPYTVFRSGGKLKKNTRQLVTLGELLNVPLSWNRCSEQGCMDYRVKWNGTNLVMDATRNQETSWTWRDLDAPEIVVFNEGMWDFNFWSESLGGSGRINIFDPITGGRIVPSDSTEVIFHREEVVYPGVNVPSSLICFEQCPDPSVINAANPYFTASSFEASWEQTFSGINQGAGGGPGVAPDALQAGTNYIAYSFDPTAMELLYGDSRVVQTSNANRQFGVWTGAMIEPTEANLEKLACDWDQEKTCVWQVWDKVDVFYKWETGSDNGNSLMALRDGEGSFLSFDPPMMLEYTHTNNAKYYLQYNGFDLMGIPGMCVDMDTGLEVQCFNQDSNKQIRWVPSFAIPEGSVLTNVVTSTRYYTKPLDVEVRMLSTDVANCTDAGLSLATYDLPDSSGYVAPDLGTEPTITSSPAVIDGVVQ